MNPPQVYMCSPSWTLFPPPSPFHPSGSSQCTSTKHPVSCIERTLKFLNENCFELGCIRVWCGKPTTISNGEILQQKNYLLPVLPILLISIQHQAPQKPHFLPVRTGLSVPDFGLGVPQAEPTGPASDPRTTTPGVPREGAESEVGGGKRVQDGEHM